jgi:hypothetical protein
LRTRIHSCIRTAEVSQLFDLVELLDRAARH